jgi:hypothetical protein
MGVDDWTLRCYRSNGALIGYLECYIDVGLLPQRNVGSGIPEALLEPIPITRRPKAGQAPPVLTGADLPPPPPGARAKLGTGVSTTHVVTRSGTALASRRFKPASRSSRASVGVLTEGTRARGPRR